jgi:endonuclease YncB( thermonuclease family)
VRGAALVLLALTAAPVFAATGSGGSQQHAMLRATLKASAPSPVYRVDHVADGDTITLRNGQRVRLVQIDTPEVYFGTECSRVLWEGGLEDHEGTASFGHVGAAQRAC